MVRNILSDTFACYKMNHSQLSEGPQDHLVLLFDGTCVLCDAFFQWILKADTKKVFSFATLQSAFGQKIIASYPQTAEVDSVILWEDQKIYIYSDAALKVMVHLGGGARWLGKFGLLFPRFIRDGVYRFVAKHRHHWFGEKACLIPDQALKNRFREF